MSLQAVSSVDQVPQLEQRVPPHDLAAEQSTLGGMLLSPDAVAEAMEYVRGADFYSPKHEIIFDAAMSLFSHSEPVDAITVGDEIAKRGDIAKIGGRDYLHTLTSIVPTAANVGYYARMVQEKATLRRLVEAGTRIAQMGYAAEGEVTDLVNAAQNDVYAITRQGVGDDYAPLSDSIELAIEEIENAQKRDGDMTGVPTGFQELDAMTHGLHPGQLVIIAARPAVGKSTLALDMARTAAITHRRPVIFFSLEMSRAEIALRMLSAESKIYMQTLRKGSLNDNDWTRLAAVRGEINDAPLFIDDSPNMTLPEIRAKCRRLASQVGLQMIVIDYIQLMTSGKKVESRQQEVSEFSRALKLLAKEIQVPVIAISQLNRNSEKSDNKVPEISHLRESGSLEQDADVIMLLHREAMYDKEHSRAGEADIYLAKQRNGPTGKVTVNFLGQYSKFEDPKR